MSVVSSKERTRGLGMVSTPDVCRQVAGRVARVPRGQPAHGGHVVQMLWSVWGVVRGERSHTTDGPPRPTQLERTTDLPPVKEVPGPELSMDWFVWGKIPGSLSCDGSCFTKTEAESCAPKHVTGQRQGRASDDRLVSG